MRLLILSDGASVHTRRWADYFRDRGHQVLLASLEARAGAEGQARLGGFPWPRPLRYLAAANQARKAISSFRPDLVNAHFLPSYGLTGALAGFHPLALSTWGSDVLVSPWKTPLHRARARYVISRADLITCDGDNLAEKLLSLGAAVRSIVKAAMGVDRVFIRDRQDELEDKETVTVISTRSLEPCYDLATLVRAMPLVIRETARTVRFIIVGGGRQLQALRGLAASLGLGRQVSFEGAVPHSGIAGHLDAADIYVSTSRTDSTSVSLLEAMARGLVPVVTDIPGNREWVEEGVNGFLFEPGDERELADRILQLVQKPAPVDAIRHMNRELLEARGIWQDNMAAIEKAFAELAASASKS